MLQRAALFVFAFALFAASASAQQDPFMGTWKLNLSKSKYDPGPAPQQPTVIKREALPGGQIKFVTDGVDGQGNKTHTEGTLKLDGKDYPVTGSPNWDMESVRRIDASTRLIVDKKAGTVVRMVRQTVAKDGRSYTADQVGVNAQGAFHNVLVYDKQ